MAIGELFLSAFLQVLFDRLASRDLLQFARREGLHVTLKKWERKLKTIESVLIDAEEKHLTDNAVKMWLDDLRDLAYDLEDILDECATEALRRKLMTTTTTHGASSSSSSKVRGVFFACFSGDWSPSAVKFSVSMRSKIKNVDSRMEELCELKADFGLKDIGGKKASSSTSTAAVYQRPPTTCLPTELAVYGRDEEKAEVLEMVLREEPNDANFAVVSIVGMGGLGKTTLAREVYHDKAVKDFEPKAWVCVSDDFDVFRISKAILESITLKPSDLKDLNQVHLQLKDALAGKKFLLVLDDVWSEDYTLWESLRSPFMVGAAGSKVIVTTRNEKVALMMGSIGDCHKLQSLSHDACWSVFKMHAFQNTNINSRPNLELIRDKVVEKCRGLPLAAKTLGGLLCSKQRDDEWDDILNSGIWNLSDEDKILPVLKLSYHHLPSHLKRCFAYSAIIPKDYEFNKKDLVLLWMAEGLIQKQNNDNKPLEDLGGKYFNELLVRSLFQQSVSDESKYVMHDLINDLAQWVCGETSFRLEEKNEENQQPIMSERARHFSFISTSYNDKEKFEELSKVERLRTFLALPSLGTRYCSNCYIPIMVVSDLLSKFKKLRALSLKDYFIVELPDSIGGLIHLRYLNLSGTKIRSLPKSASSLFNLQTLILRYCSHLVKLPSNIENMSKLQHLNIRGTISLREMPPGLKELKDLEILSDFVVGKDGAGCALEDLKNLKFLREELHITRLDNMVGAQDTREAILSNKKGLKVLELEWGSQFDNSHNESEEKNVLEILQPHTNLRRLTLKYYGGTIFPAWLGDSSFSNMTVLRLESCENCTSLPSLGLLSSLKDLTIVGMKRLKSLASEFYGEGCLKPFQSLEILRFENLEEWDSWETMNNSDHVETFHRLLELSIKKCPKLSGKLPDHLPSLEKLVIRECAQLVVSLSSLPVLFKLEVDGCKRVAWCCPSDSQSLNSMTLSNISEFGTWSMQGFKKVESLVIDGCEELIHMWQNEMPVEKTPKELHVFNSIRKLSVFGCPNLVLFPEICFLPLLSVLKIKDCNALMSLPEGMKQKNVYLECLVIDGNRSLSFMTGGQLPSSLKKLELRNCEKLQFVFADAEETCTSSSSYSAIQEENINDLNIFLEMLIVISCSSLTCLSTRDQLPATLKYLHIYSCSNLTTLSREQLPGSLQELEIIDCLKLESITERFHNSMLLETITIGNCENFESTPEGIHKLSRLRDIGIFGCPSLVCFPEGGIPNANLRRFSIINCKNLKAIPRGLQTLDYLCISRCPSIKSFPEECFHTKLTTLVIGDLYLYERLIQWGLYKLTSLTSLEFRDIPDVVSFEIGMMLPTSLTHLEISSFPKLKYLTSDGFQNLTSLVNLSIWSCPNLISFPKIGLPPSLMLLYIYDCLMLKERCRKDRGQEWPKIAHIPCTRIDGKLIHDIEE
ncbi:hypothetical protein JRO89_XS09G0010600 [Xanthoceras sorbifolium]|uniref:Disease resistance RPP13-like protein 1 n=1 Tax=Xanthoceras sorbifolium TaxID=99658 RepID=A0ABQ8HK38_9ROSI|nr:hypothetical protein JRO89_XS09G0010600 [Xanthoceras sorbifolium]